MLQYSVPLPPLSLSSSKPKARKASTVSTDPTHDSNMTTTRRTSTRSRPGPGPAYGHPLPLAISTSFQSQPSAPSPLSQPGRSSPLSYSPSGQSSFSSPSLPPTPALGSAFPFPRQTVSPRVSAAQLQQKGSTRSPFLSNATLPSAPVPMQGTRSPRPPISPQLQYVNGLPSPSLGHSTTGDMSSRDSYYARSPSGASSRGSSFSSTALDVLAPGDKVGEGVVFQGEALWRVPIGESSQMSAHKEEPAQVFEVVRRLGTGSYAVVYLVREVLHMESEEDRQRLECENDGEDLDMSLDGHESDVVCREKVPRGNVYGKEYAIKLLSKANLDEEALSAQMFEATIHQLLPTHPNIVTLHRTLETPSYLLLLLEFVPGEDLFYFLEQARDHYDLPAPSVPSTPAITSAPLIPSALSSPLPSTSPTNSTESYSSDFSSRTPPTPSLLATLSPNKLLSRTRLKLISSMFKQMCDAVAACHDRGVYHRDIKPENFIVTDGILEVDVQGEKRRERRVIVKLSDFGLSTTDMHSADMDCGSAPYMSYECRNNLHPTYMPRAADVWSLGIVLINMLYHYNPWTDTTEGACPSFTLFRQNPTSFFLTRFSGMTQPVAEFLANKVFCILPDSGDDSARIGAKEFGQWIRDLPDLLSPSPLRPGSGHSRTGSISLNMAEMQSHRLASIPHSRRPSLRSATGSRDASQLANQRASWIATMSRPPSLVPAFEEQENIAERSSIGVGIGGLPAVIDQEGEEEDNEQDQSQPGSRTASTQKRRKRGARKGKGKEAVASLSAQDKTLEALAGASQALARELSKTSKHPSSTTVPSPLAASAVFNSVEFAQQNAQKTVVPTPAVIAKKPSKWRLGFGKSSSSSSNVKEEQEAKASSTASNVTNLIMGLSAPAQPKAHAQPPSSTHPYNHPTSAASASTASFVSHAPSRYAPTVSANSSVVSLDDPTHTRGRRYKGVGPAKDVGEGMWGASTVSAFANSGHAPRSDTSSLHPYLQPPTRPQQIRGVSPASASAVSVMSASTASSNWRSSMASSAATSTSAFTRYSNGSVRSVSTAATSVSNTSWRSGGAKSTTSSRNPQLPPNIKVMNGQPWELSELPRQMYLDPESVKFSSPPPVRKRVQKPKNSNLDTISERPAGPSPRMDASTSTTDLSALEEIDDGTGSPRKVQKGQINALAKMLSALRR